MKRVASLVGYLSEEGYSPALIANALSFAAISSLIGRVLVGYLLDKIHAAWDAFHTYIDSLDAEQLTEHGGGEGIRDAGLLESALQRPLNKFAYGDPDVFDLAAAYAFGIARNHPFVDGNKRTAWLAAATFLAVNGVDLAAVDQDRAGKALLVTLQELVWVRQLADRAGFLQEGRQVLARTREELRYEDLERLYLDYTRGGLTAR